MLSRKKKLTPNHTIHTYKESIKWLVTIDQIFYEALEISSELIVLKIILLCSIRYYISLHAYIYIYEYINIYKHIWQSSILIIKYFKACVS